MIADLFAGLVATTALAAPGWWLARRYRLPLPALAGLAGGAVALMLLVVTADALGLGIGRGMLAAGWSAIAAGCFVAGRTRPAVGAAPGAPDWRGWLPLAPLLLVVAYRAAAQPLHGADTVFRWEFLARQMWTKSSLAFYPPVTAADYASYGWPDGIAPLVASLYHGIYTVTGAVRPVATAPVVLLQVVLLFAAVRALARRDFSARAALFAGLLLATMPLASWAASMGQETGLTALSVLGLLLYLPRNRAEESAPAVIAAAVLASLGALAREYGLIFPVLGLLLAGQRGLSRRALVRFAATCAALVVPWYARNWVLTGNPLFNHDLGGLFPVNQAHARLMALYGEELSWRQLPPEAPRVFLTYGVTALFGALAGAAACLRQARVALGFAAVMTLLYLYSLGHTAGGYFYALRLLNPAFALCAVIGGGALARWIPGRAYLAGACLGLSLLGADAALRNLTLPANPYRLPPSAWLKAGNAIHEYPEPATFELIAKVIAGSRVIVLGPHAQLQKLGVACAPPWSPAVEALFSPEADPADIARRLRQEGFGFCLMYRGELNQRYLAASPLFRPPASHLQVALAGEDLLLLRIAAPD